MSKQDVDQAVMTLLTKVREKKEQIKKASKRPQWKTNCSFTMSNENTQNRTNIQTIRDKNKLIEFCSFLMSKTILIEEAAKELNLVWDKKYMGFHIDEWICDLKTRANMLILDRQKKELLVLDERVNKLVTSEQRREMELQELQKLLS